MAMMAAPSSSAFLQPPGSASAPRFCDSFEVPSSMRSAACVALRGWQLRARDLNLLPSASRISNYPDARQLGIGVCNSIIPAPVQGLTCWETGSLTGGSGWRKSSSSSSAGRPCGSEPPVVGRNPSGVAASGPGWGGCKGRSGFGLREMSSLGVVRAQLLPLSDERSEKNDDSLAFVELANKLADAAGKIILQYFRKGFDIIDKEDLSPVTVADRAAEEAMRLLIAKHFPSHAIFGEEGGLHMPDSGADYLWVLDPIDGTKSFITGKPVFGTLIALLHKGVPVLGIIDQPVLRERWVGRKGERTTLNGEEIAARLCSSLSSAYLYTTSPHLFSPQTKEGFARVRNKVKIPLYGCDCYAYGLLAAGHVDLVIESGLKPYDYLALIPVVEGAGGIMTDWNGRSLTWWPDENQPNSGARGVEVIASGCNDLHEAALKALDWH